MRYGLHMKNTAEKQAVLTMMKNAFATLMLLLLTQTVFSQVSTSSPVAEFNDTITPNPLVENPVEVEFKEWLVPWEDTRPRDPDVAPSIRTQPVLQR